MKRLLLIFVATLLIVGVVSATVTKTETTDGEYTVIKWTTDLAAGGGQDSTTWDVPAGATEVEYLVVAGGGGGGGRRGAGGGAGGMRTATGLAVSGTVDVKIGAGGVGGDPAGNRGGNGSDSAFLTITSDGGGTGGTAVNLAGLAGGSGGGSVEGAAVGTGTSGQGSNGGVGVESAPNYGAGGGGGKSATGSGGSSTTGGNGGNGQASSITGSAVTYAGGGGGGSYGGTAGNGGTGGGGAGSTSDTTATSGADGLGGAGGGGGFTTSGAYGGAGGSGVVIIRYLTPLSLSANFTASNTSGIQPLLVAFTDTSTTTDATIDSWAWDFGDGNTSASQSPSHTYDVPGTYQANLTITNSSYSLTSTKLSNITVYYLPVCDFVAWNTAGTAPFTTYFYDTSTNLNAGPYTYYTDFGDGNTSTEQNTYFTWNITGTYDINHCITDSVTTACNNKTAYVTVGSPETAPIASFYGGPQLGAPPLQVFFTDVSTNTPTGWNWSHGDGTYSIIQNPTHWYNKSGFYTVGLTASNGAGSNTSTQTNFVMVY